MKYVKSYATGEYEEKKSRFIGEVFPIQSVDEAEALIQQVRKNIMMHAITAMPMCSVISMRS